MPLVFEGITAECLAVRTSVGIFDVSHMGRLVVSGPEAGKFLDFVTTNDVQSLSIGEGQYSLLCNEKGGIVDDITLFRTSGTEYLVVYNAGNRGKDLSWLASHATPYRTELRDVSNRVAMFAVQGPESPPVLSRLLGMDPAGVSRFCAAWVRVNGVRLLVSRTGYTGDEGFEVYVWDSPVERPTEALNIWERILSLGRRYGIRPCGLAARDVLRLEAGMCLYGNDMDEERNPLEARLRFAVKLDKAEFIGKQAISEISTRPLNRVRVGVRLLTRGIPRPHQVMLAGEDRVGDITSGTLSPLLKIGIAMGYVRPDLSKPGKKLQVQVREKKLPAEIVKLPFYQRKGPDRLVFLGTEISQNEFKERLESGLEGALVAN